jgi:two-component system, NtrC family, sensor kinase
MPFKNTTLAFRFTLFSVVFSTVTAGLIGSYLVRLSYNALRQQAQQGQLVLARSLASHIDQGTSQAFQAVAVLAKLPGISALDPKALERELSLVTSATELLDALIATDIDGTVIVRSRTALSPHQLPSRRALHSELARVARLDGAVLVEMYRTPNGEPGFLIRAPIKRNGVFVGTLAGVLYLQGHSIGNLDAGKFGEDGYAYLVNEEGVGLVHPQKSRVMQDLSDNPAVQELQRRESGIILFTNAEGQQVLSAFAKVPSAGWGVIVRRPAGELFSPAAKMLKVMSLLLAAALGLGALGMALLARRLSAPLLGLAAKVQTIESGAKRQAAELDDQAPLEIRQLAAAIEGMERRLGNKELRRKQAHQRAIQAERKLAATQQLAAVGQLAAGLAHELNNPLTVIQGSAKELERRPSKGRELWLGNIRRETRRCIRLVGDLLTLSRPANLKLQRVELRALVQEAWGHVLLTGWQGALLQMQGPKRLQVKVDADRFKQVLVNLLTNALQASPGKQPKVMVAWSASGRRVQLEIRDHGSGMAKEVRDRAFHPFFTTKADGTGLGLAIAYSLVRAHGGRLRIESRNPGTALISDWPQGAPPRKGAPR